MSTTGIVRWMRMEDGTIVVGRARDVDTVRTTSKLFLTSLSLDVGCKSKLLQVSICILCSYKIFLN